MDTSKVFTKIKELGHVNSKREELREFCRLKFEQIIKFLPRRIVNNDGGDLLDCILNGMPDNVGACKNKVKVIELVLKTMRKESTSLTHCGDVASRLCLELPRLPLEDLVRWSNDSVQSIVEDSDVNMIWRDVLPECINAISSHDTVKHCGTDMSSAEYKEQCVRTLCQCNWKERQLVQLTAMFKDMQLSRNDHRQVVNKICSYIIDIPPDTLPPLVHQLLKLCKTYNLEAVLSHLAHYFSVRLYSKLEPPPQDSESTTIDIDDITPHSPAELSRCLSTCIYHISQGAADPALVRKHIKMWPKTQLLRAPFLIDLALAMSDKGADFRTVCLDVIKSAIEQRAVDELKAKESAWVRSVLAPDVDVVSLLKLITTESANHRQLTVVGLINVAFLLLSTSRTKPVAPTCWSHGKLILVRLSKSQPECAAHILTQLADRLAGDTTQTQYSDCLYILCKLTPVSIERCTQLSTILENCQPTPTDFRSAAAVLDAIHPLLNFSTRSRDTLVMVCRKGLYSRDSQHRCLALSGFLTVLRHVRVSGSVSNSQQYSEQYSAHSYLTQLTVDLHATHQGNAVTSRVRNEAMCMEVVSILRRCLVQDALVKQLLYTKIYECASDKQSLHENILELLFEHLSKYLPDGGNPAQLLMDKCVQINGVTVVLVEPIARLLYAVAQFLQPCDEEDLEDILASQSVETASAHLKSKLAIIMEQLGNCDNLGNIDMEDPGLSDITPESKAKCLKVQQVLQCYETLIAHQIMQWNVNSSNAIKVHKLFKACNELIEQTKAPSKSSKKGNKTLNETRETIKSTQKSQKSTKSQKEKGKGPVKMSSLVKDKAGPFKQLPCVWDLKLCVRVVELLYSEEVPWSSVEQRNHIRVRRDFHAWCLRCIQSVLSEHLDKKSVASHCVSIATILYKRCICRFQDMCEFDDQTTLGCIEVFKTCLTLLFSPTYSLKMEGFLSAITDSTEPSPPAYIAIILESLYSAIQYIEEESAEEERDVVGNKQLAALLQAAGLFLEVPVATCPTMTTIIVKFADYIRNSKQDCLGLVSAVLTAEARDQQESQLMDELLTKLASALGRIDEEDTSVTAETTDFSTIDARTGHTVLATICAQLATRAKSVEHLLARARDLSTALTNATHVAQQRIEKEIAEVYKSLIVQLCQLTSWTAKCCKLRCSVGGAGGSERVLGAAVRLYSLLAALAKQIDVHVAQHARFERLLKLSGKKLSSVTDNLITYLEASQQQQNASKVLRETKLIPRLVLEAEQYCKRVILLSNKAKLNWQQYLSLGTARDFRIKAPVLQQVLNAREENNETRDEEEAEIDDAATEIVDELSDNEVEEDDGEQETKRKRRRVS
ncbi:Fanconi anemia complementation group I [Anticarsia gemmatalis]|uniref:Fanconi anemia complementation group I n=1 Tax=Anticarsia gemmatalis TaxID=129554 RepID=UPI003F759AC5